METDSNSILVADCGTWTTGLLTRELRRRGCTVYTARAELEAVNWFTALRDGKKRLKVVVLDGRLPLADIRLLAREMKTGEESPALLVLGDGRKPKWMELFEISAQVEFMDVGCDIQALAGMIKKLSGEDGGREQYELPRSGAEPRMEAETHHRQVANLK